MGEEEEGDEGGKEMKGLGQRGGKRFRVAGLPLQAERHSEDSEEGMRR